MIKKVIILISIYALLIIPSQSVTFDCKYAIYSSWATLTSAYVCDVQNAVSITSPQVAQVDSIIGTHLAGYNNDNITLFTLHLGQIQFFPRGLEKFFKNLKAIQIADGVGMKEVHQSDLKPFPMLLILSLRGNQLEILEKNLFEFNSNLEWIALNSNKITYIDPNVFDKLNKLRTLFLNSNTCINSFVTDNPARILNIINATRTQCVNSDYANLEQKVKNLENEAESLNSQRLKEKLDILETEVRNSIYLNFFLSRLEALKAIQMRKEVEEAATTTTTTIATTIIDTTKESQITTCAELELKIDNIAAKLNETLTKIDKIFKVLFPNE